MHFLTGEKPDHWLSTGTISRWNKEVATLCLHQNCPRDTKSHFYSYGIMCDESTRGDKRVRIKINLQLCLVPNQAQLSNLI